MILPLPGIQRQEALRLYRDILKTSRSFTWPDASGKPWRLQLVASARKEFEQSKSLKDPEMIARSILNGQLALTELEQKFAAKLEQLRKQEQEVLIHVQSTRNDKK
eukprot:NODE_6696_length_544_cov_15.775758_g6274_i0.p2 GENE.NODE_6696_length_544_cov_15.775758_g6274_i0~~NODE_6696_length_544_cov_15.775758_g6274_i0.p2  ORF type:complete len:106 (+),score=25.64 NODE_6696_length_544_cov_15.775758_g6274_i0:180-497(+)